MSELVGYDIDGTLNRDDVAVIPGDCVVISGRTFAEYDDLAKALAQRVPVYIRGSGEVGDRTAAALFKAAMIRHLGVARFYDDDPEQAQLIRERVGDTCAVYLVTRRSGPQ